MTKSDEQTKRELAVRQAFTLMDNREPPPPTVSVKDLAPSVGADFGGALPFMDQPLAKVVGLPAAKRLLKLGLFTVTDLLRHYPRRYAEPGKLTDISKLEIGEHVTIQARVVRVQMHQMKSRPGVRMQVTVTDDRNNLDLTFFGKGKNSMFGHSQKIKEGRQGLFTGVVSVFNNTRQLTHPDYLIVGIDAADPESTRAAAARPMPIYPAAAKVSTWHISAAVKTVLAQLREQDVPDPVPDSVLTRHSFVSLYQAFLDVHEPEDEKQWHRGQYRLRYEEAFLLQGALVQRRAEAQELTAISRPVQLGPSILSRFDEGLPFNLTAGQVKVGHEIANDLARPIPMQRLLQGDVGAGKTVVALRAMLQVIADGGQAALLAPTEVLAAQHARSIAKILGPLAAGGTLEAGEFATRVTLLTGSLPAAARKAALLDAASGAAGIIVGTHALLSEHVQFAELGLVVVDEQHRFGVEQRDTLRNRAVTVPHLLVMTATPIPRTVAMTVFGDLETSILAELPRGRAGIETFLVPADNPAWLRRTWQRAREEIDAGRGVYVVCPRISSTDQSDSKSAPKSNRTAGRGPEVGDVPESALVDIDDPRFDPHYNAAQQDFEQLDLELVEPSAEDRDNRRQLHAVLDMVDRLRDLPVFESVRVSALHGKMTAPEKEQAMAQFTAGEVDILVSTTVIEVGVDVPRASVMIIMDADRFGISQLHQLRGRVGRGSDRGICLLVASVASGSDADRRLRALVDTTDGFKLATVDLELRAEGDVLGTAQSGGRSSLKLLRVIQDANIIYEARADAIEALSDDRHLTKHPALVAAIAQRLGPERAVFLDRS